ncbi:MAG: hypothetical protein ABIP63_04430 [Thermoanaerobaculia bacterium]
MGSSLVQYLAGRPDTATFLLPQELQRNLEELFPNMEALLPQPYKIFPIDETHSPAFGFPVAEAPVLKEMDAKLDRWLTDEVVWQVGRQPAAKEKAQVTFAAYLAQLMRLAENALLSNLLNDYHAVFWLAHSLDLGRHFCSIPRRVSAVDVQAGRTQGDALKYRIYAKWTSETREAMTQVAIKAAAVLDGEEQRGLQFFRLLQDDVLAFTEEFIGPDLRELRPFVNGYLRRDFQSFRDGYERLRNVATETLQKDRTFRASLPLFGANPDQGITLALLLDGRFQPFLFDHPSVQNVLSREDREQFQLIAKRLREFAILNQLRRGITWMSTSPEGDIVSTDKRSSMSFSRSTRPLDFGRPGVVDPMIYRFGLIYDISNFTETLGNVRRAGKKEEVNSYRHMLLFQRKIESVAERHLLQFEKFLGDGAFYTTRRALRLVRGAVEIQHFYSEMRKKGFAFNKGLRIAVNYGYYRLLPMKVASSEERITEFYGPGIVELSRLTTGKANKEIEDFAAFLMAHGYNQAKVQQFFAPLAHGVDVIDHTEHAREFYAYVNVNGHLINEGIVASMSLLQELSNELSQEGQPLYALKAPWGNYLGFAPAIDGVEFLGVRLIGTVSLKGLDQIEVGEIASFAPGAVEATPLEAGEPLVARLRQDFHRHDSYTSLPGVDVTADSTHERMVPSEIVLCAPEVPEDGDEVLMGIWDPVSDDIHNPVVIPRGDFRRLCSLEGILTTETLSVRKETVCNIYLRLSDRATGPRTPVRLASYRSRHDTDAFILGDIVEKL